MLASRRLVGLASSLAFSIPALAFSTQRRFSSLDELQKTLGERKFVLFLGNGPRYQYESVDEIVDKLQPVIETLKQETSCNGLVAIFGGDTFVPAHPDLGAVMKAVKDRFGLQLCAVAGWDEIDTHVDFSIHYKIEVDTQTGRELYGGVTSDGKLVGGSAVYLSPEWLKHTHAVISVSPKGTVGKQELEYVMRASTVPVVHVEAPPKTMR
jgi:hypothetical protein